MNVIYNSASYCVVEYPSEHGYEIVDKHAARNGFIRHDVADRFLASMRNAAREDASVQHIDEYLESVDGLMTVPLTIH